MTDIKAKLYNKVLSISSGSYDFAHPAARQIILGFRLDDGTTRRVVLGNEASFVELLAYEHSSPLELVVAALDIVKQQGYLWKPKFQIELEELKDRFEKAQFKDKCLSIQDEIDASIANIKKCASLLIELCEEPGSKK